MSGQKNSCRGSSIAELEKIPGIEGEMARIQRRQAAETEIPRKSILFRSGGAGWISKDLYSTFPPNF
jgi:hypothetical protein